MNPVLLVFFVSSVAGHVSLRYNPREPVSGLFRFRHNPADEGRQPAQSIVDTLQKAHETKDETLYLSVFDKSFSAFLCNTTATYSDVEEAGVEGSPIKYGREIYIINPVLDGDELTFTVWDKRGIGKFHFDAKRSGKVFKITTFKITTFEDINCSPKEPRRLRNNKRSISSSEEEHYNFEK